MMRLVLLQLGFLIQGFLAIDPLVANGYRNVIVSIHPDINVDANSQETIISNIKVRKGWYNILPSNIQMFYAQ